MLYVQCNYSGITLELRCEIFFTTGVPVQFVTIHILYVGTGELRYQKTSKFLTAMTW